jgi:hypothetical protein
LYLVVHIASSRRATSRIYFPHIGCSLSFPSLLQPLENGIEFIGMTFKRHGTPRNVFEQISVAAISVLRVMSRNTLADLFGCTLSLLTRSISALFGITSRMPGWCEISRQTNKCSNQTMNLRTLDGSRTP